MKCNYTKNTFLLGLILTLFVNIGLAQIQTPLDAGLRYVEAKSETWGLTQTDINNLAVNSMYASEHNGVTHIYLIQRHEGIEVYNAITSVHVTPEGEAHSVGNRFVTNLKQKINTTTPSLKAEDALAAAMAHLGLGKGATALKERVSKHEFIFEKNGIAHTDINVKLRFQPTKDNQVRLAWDLAIEQLDRKDYWSMRVDAETGEIIDQNNWMVHCQFVDDPYHNHDASCNTHLNEQRAVPVAEILKNESTVINAAIAGSYNVFGESIDGQNSPHESPIHGERTMMVDPYTGASPYGWHDTNGTDGAEYTMTRGNNVHAYLDLNNTSTPTGEPDGGEALVFDFPYNPLNEPEDQRDLAVTNLFYMVNTMHDFIHNFGMDEAAGAFQANNYGNWNTGGNDYVLAEAQDGNGDVNNINNANFATPPDGGNGVMQMYLWDQAGGKLLTVTSPSAVAGGYETGSASYGPAVGEEPITGQIVVAIDGSSEPSFGCEELLVDPDEDLEGKIVMVDRGGCFFETKTLNAQAKGAIACIICNFEDSPVGMGGGIDSDEPTIPTISLGANQCSLLKAAMSEGVMGTIQLPNTDGATLLDGDLDNGIIAHEYAHGISNRLTGGPLAAGCLGNAEQMGEGWSDIYTLMTSVKPGDTGEMRRGIGTYVERQETAGSGIRPLPYSTDMGINNHTYDDVIRFSESVHSIGAVWTQMLWDMYWDLVEVYGFDIDMTNAAAGNNIAAQLITDGLKLQPCSPGFVDGRDAILLADMMNNEGANQCLIWKAFARRGLGFYADQGDRDSAADGIASFEPLPICVKELKIVKTASEVVNAGEAIDFTITVTNHKDEAATNVLVTDLIPDGCTYVAGSASNDGTASGGSINWDLGTLATGDVVTLTYQAMTASEGSTTLFYDDFENPSTVNVDWVSYTLDLDLENYWTYIENVPDFVNSGTHAYIVADDPMDTDQVLQLNQPFVVTGDSPVLRFFHLFDTQRGKDGGFVQYSKDGGVSWFDVGDRFFKNPYTSQVSYQTFTIPFQEAFSGVSNGFIESFVDLSDFAGETLFFRWRFGSDADGVGGIGWAIDDVSFVNLVSYNEEACVTSGEGDMACDNAAFKGTIIEPAPLAIEDLLDPTLGLSVYPNPAQNYLTINLASEFTEAADLTIVGADGRIVRQLAITTNAGIQTQTMDVSNLASGFYFVRVMTSRGIAIEKVVID